MRIKGFVQKVICIEVYDYKSPLPSQRSEQQLQRTDTLPAGLVALSDVWWSVAVPSLIKLIMSVKWREIERIHSVRGHVTAPTSQSRFHTQAVNKSLAPNSSQPFPKINPKCLFNLENKGICKSTARDPVWRLNPGCSIFKSQDDAQWKQVYSCDSQGDQSRDSLVDRTHIYTVPL